MSRTKTRRLPRLENLEVRQLLSADISGTQQLMLELINEALVDPEAAADRVEQNLTRGAIKAISDDGDSVEKVVSEIAGATPRPPVAWDADLAVAAEKHTDFQIKIGRQTHHGPTGLENVTDRVIAAGYQAPEVVAENIIYGVDSPEHAMTAFLADYGAANSDDPHRKNIQQPDPGKKSLQEVGVAILPVEVPVDVPTPFGAPKTPKTETKLVVTQVFASKESASPKLLGVVFEDADHDRFYDADEGISGASVTIINKASGASTTVRTWASGGYQAEVPAGEYRVEVRRGDQLLDLREVRVGQENTKLDFMITDSPRSISTSSSSAPKAVTATTQSASKPQEPKSTPTVRSSGLSSSESKEGSSGSNRSSFDKSRSQAAPPSLPTQAIDGTVHQSSTTSSARRIAAEQSQDRSRRTQPLTQTPSDSTISLLRSSLSRSLRSWKVSKGAA